MVGLRLVGAGVGNEVCVRWQAPNISMEGDCMRNNCPLQLPTVSVETHISILKEANSGTRFDAVLKGNWGSCRYDVSEGTTSARESVSHRSHTLELWPLYVL